jgi:ferritin-like metal-binding protein YciE
VEAAFRSVGVEPVSARSAPAEALASAHRETAARIVEPRLRDLFHAGGAIRTEHLELAAYAAGLGLARALGAGEAERLLEENRAGEEEALRRLTELSARLRELV